MKLHEKLQNNAWVTAAIQRGIRDALIKHKAMGVAIAVWRDGKTVLVPPDEIVIPDLSVDCAVSDRTIANTPEFGGPIGDQPKRPTAPHDQTSQNPHKMGLTPPTAC